jgi:hypothetical protein
VQGREHSRPYDLDNAVLGRTVQLNLPILENLSHCENLLIAGMGGGFDLFCGLPIYFELIKQGKKVHLANYSFSDIHLSTGGIQLTDTLIGITADVGSNLAYFPERHLAQWFRDHIGTQTTIWSFSKTGVRPLLDNYRTLISHLSIDSILLMDGGVDSLLRGDEVEVGTILEDAISLIAVSELKEISVRLLACLGFGAEQDITYAQVFENIAKLAEIDALLGSCSLVKQMDCYQSYESAVMYAQAQANQDSSVINSSVISAVNGKYGNHHLTEKTRGSGSKLWISPLMPIYWFFDLPVVARRNLLFSTIRYTDSRTEAYRGLLQSRKNLVPRKPSKIHLS